MNTFSKFTVTSFVLFFPFAQAQAYDDPKCTSPKKDGIKHGLEKCYFDNAKKQIRYSKTWVNDSEVGPYKMYDSNGKIREEGEYINNGQNHKLCKYYEDGHLIRETTYDTGAKKGPEKEYFSKAEGGKIKLTTIHASNSEEIGPRKEYANDGTLQSVIHYKKNFHEFKTRETYYETGAIRQVEFEGQDKKLTVEYKLSGKISNVTCSPGKQSEAYSYTLDECQANYKFKIDGWKPAP